MYCQLSAHSKKTKRSEQKGNLEGAAPRGGKKKKPCATKEGRGTSGRGLRARLCLCCLSRFKLVLQQMRHCLKELPFLVEHSVRLVQLLLHHCHTAREVAGRVRGVLLRHGSGRAREGGQNTEGIQIDRNRAPPSVTRRAASQESQPKPVRRSRVHSLEQRPMMRNQDGENATQQGHTSRRP